MSVLSAASGKSAWRGYEYYTQNKVISWRQIDKDIYEGAVAGSGEEPYHIILDVAHPARSKCDCPHAEGKRIVCKHKVAVYFAIFPEEVDNYLKLVKEAEEEEKARVAARYEEIESYVKTLSKTELRRELTELLYELRYERWQNINCLLF